MAQQKTQQEIVQDAWKKEKKPDEILQEARQKLMGPGDNCRCMTAFTCSYCGNIMMEMDRKDRERELLESQSKNISGEDARNELPKEEKSNNVTNKDNNEGMKEEEN